MKHIILANGRTVGHPLGQDCPFKSRVRPTKVNRGDREGNLLKIFRMEWNGQEANFDISNGQVMSTRDHWDPGKSPLGDYKQDHPLINLPQIM